MDIHIPIPSLWETISFIAGAIVGGVIIGFIYERDMTRMRARHRMLMEERDSEN